ncbi:hypothetical protein EMIT047CA2_90056 [Pseudomonas soli]
MQGNAEVRSKDTPQEADVIERRLSAVEEKIRAMQAADDTVAAHVTQMRAFIDGLSADVPV